MNGPRDEKIKTEKQKNTPPSAHLLVKMKVHIRGVPSKVRLLRIVKTLLY